MASSERSECRAFHWIGQTRRSCDNCGRPEWEHDGWVKHIGGPMSAEWELAAWTPEQAQRMTQARAAWDANRIYEQRTRFVRDTVGRTTTIVEKLRYGRDVPQGDVVEEVSRDVA